MYKISISDLDTDYIFTGESLCGKQYGYMCVLALAGVKHYNNPKRVMVYWLCRCSCGKEKIVSAANLKTKHVQSCGCFQERSRTRHGYGSNKNKHPMYRVWDAMVGRCTRPKTVGYKNYGGRGIKVCGGWRVFIGFLKDMGPEWKPGLTIERKDVNGNYEKCNCRWATRKEQGHNRRNNIRVEYEGLNLTVSQWAERLNINYDMLLHRIKCGWSAEKALTKPSQRKKK